MTKGARLRVEKIEIDRQTFKQRMTIANKLSSRHASSVHAALTNNSYRNIDMIRSRLQAVWSIAHEVKGKYDSTPISPGMQTRKTGFVVGSDHLINEDLRLGIMAAYARRRYELDCRGGARSGDSDLRGR